MNHDGTTARRNFFIFLRRVVVPSWFITGVLDDGCAAFGAALAWGVGAEIVGAGGW